MERRVLRSEVPGWALVAAAVIAIWALLSVDGANEPDPTAPQEVRVRYLTDDDRALLERVAELMSTTTAPLPPAQADAVDRAREALAQVAAGDVEVDPPTTTTTAAPTTTTTVPVTTTSTTPPLADLVWPDTTEVTIP